jgi:OOP family OmpA-OmpF porin
MVFGFNLTNISKVFLIAFLVLNSSKVVYSQPYRTMQPNSDNWEIGINMGLLNYLGDVGSNSDFSSPFKNNLNLGFGISLSKQLSPIFGIKGNLLIGPINGESDVKINAGVITQNPADISTPIVLKSQLIGANINATLNLSNLFLGIDREQLINVYGLVGLGLGNFKGRITDKNTPNIIYHEFGYHNGRGINGYQIQGIGNLGLSIVFDIGHNLNASIESTFKFMKDDNLVSSVGNTDIDSYNYTSLGIAYKIPFSKNHQWYCR